MHGTQTVPGGDLQVMISTGDNTACTTVTHTSIHNSEHQVLIVTASALTTA